MAAMRKGKHVLTEKLMGHSVAPVQGDGPRRRKLATRAVTDHLGRRPSAALQHPVRQRGRPDQQGLIGDIHHIRAQWHRGNLPGNDSWQPPLPDDKKLAGELKSWEIGPRRQAHRQCPKPDGSPRPSPNGRARSTQKRGPDRRHHRTSWPRSTAIRRQCSTAATTARPLEELIRWRLWNRTGGGLMAELGSHQLDAASIFISGPAPRRPEGEAALGRRPSAAGSIFPLDRDCEDHVYCIFEFPGPGYYEDEATEKCRPEQEDRRHLFVDQRQRLRRLRRDRVRHQGHADPRTGAGSDALQRLEHRRPRIEVKPGAGGKPALDTYETGGGAAVAQAATAENTSRGYTEEIEHWAWCIRNPDPGTSAALHAGGRPGRRRDRAHHQHRHRQKRPHRLPARWFDIDSDETPEGEPPRQAADVV